MATAVSDSVVVRVPGPAVAVIVICLALAGGAVAVAVKVTRTICWTQLLAVSTAAMLTPAGSDEAVNRTDPQKFVRSTMRSIPAEVPSVTDTALMLRGRTRKFGAAAVAS